MDTYFGAYTPLDGHLHGRRAKISWGDERYVRKLWNQPGTVEYTDGAWILRFDEPISLTPNWHMASVRILDRRAIGLLPRREGE